MILNEGLDLLIEELLEESAKTDFINKFGEDTFNKFEKAKQRLKNNGYSTDYQQYLKMSEEELINFLASLYTKKEDEQKKRIVQGTDKEIRGEYNYLGEKDGYKVYQPLDYISSMDLGVNSGWCTTGRHTHYGHPEYTPSKADARKHWNNYTKKGIKFYYFLNPTTMYGEYAIALYPKTIKVDRVCDEKAVKPMYIKEANFELYRADDVLDYSAISSLPTDLVPENLIADITYPDANGLLIDDDIVIGAPKSITSISIPDGITKIKNYAFSYHDSLTKVTIPDSVKAIGQLAFYDCKNLTDVTLPDGLRRIGDSAFGGCAKLTSISIPDSVTTIGEQAFAATDLTSVVIPNKIRKLNGHMFVYCKNLKDITLPDKLKAIGEFAFACSGITNINIPEGVTSIGRWAFKDCKDLVEVIIPDSVVDLDYHIFEGSSNVVVKTDNQIVIDYCKANKVNYQSKNN